MSNHFKANFIEELTVEKTYDPDSKCYQTLCVG